MSFVINFLEKKAGVQDDTLDTENDLVSAKRPIRKKNYRVYKGNRTDVKYSRASQKVKDFDIYTAPVFK